LVGERTLLLARCGEVLLAPALGLVVLASFSSHRCVHKLRRFLEPSRWDVVAELVAGRRLIKELVRMLFDERYWRGTRQQLELALSSLQRA